VMAHTRCSCTKS